MTLKKTLSLQELFLWLDRPLSRNFLIRVSLILFVIFCVSVFFIKKLGVAEEVKTVGAVFGGIAIVIAAAWAVVTYMNNKRLEVQRYFVEQQVAIALDTAKTVGNLVDCIGDNDKEWKETKARFWELYWGRLVLFENADVIKAMIQLGKKLNSTSFEERRTLKSEVYAVSMALRKFLEERNKDYWKFGFDTAPNQVRELTSDDETKTSSEKT